MPKKKKKNPKFGQNGFLQIIFSTNMLKGLGHEQVCPLDKAQVGQETTMDIQEHCLVFGLLKKKKKSFPREKN